MKRTVIVEDKYGGSIRYPGYNVDGWVHWQFSKLRLEKHYPSGSIEGMEIDLSDDVSCVKEYDLENNRYIVWTNPKYNYAVSINVEKVDI
jgi:hypothetical protein